MYHHRFSQTPRADYPIVFLVPRIQPDEICKAYLDPFELDPDETMVLTLHYSREKKKTPKAEMQEYVTEELQPVFDENGVKYVVVTDSEYFKLLSGAVKVDANLGYVLDSKFGSQKVVYVPSHRQIFHDPERTREKISRGMRALIDHAQGDYIPPGTDILSFEAYPETDAEVEEWLEKLLAMDCPLAIDTENFSLKHHNSGLGTISFSWKRGEGIAFCVDYEPIPNAVAAPFGREVRNERRRFLLKAFFRRLSQKAIYHNISYDAYILIYQLFMRDLLDTDGLLTGLHCLLRNWDCTKLITYLATNSCAGNKLSLKDQAQDYAGNYAQTEIKDIRNIRVRQLLRYNLVDASSTWHVYEKHRPTLDTDNQVEVYETLFKPAILDIVQMQLTGLPINKRRVREVRWALYREQRAALKRIRASKLVQQYEYQRLERYVDQMNGEWKKKRTTVSEMLKEIKVNANVREKIVFNPGSDPQLRELLYGMLGLPILAYTDGGQPSTKGEVLKDLRNHTEDPEVLALLDGVIDLAAVATILATFIPAFLGAVKGPDGWHYLFGNFNLGGTLSGRLSSSDPNLQNIPSGAQGDSAKGRYGKLIKSCIQAPPGWIFAGLDFASLEDRISALTTKDPNKLKVYTDGYDGHSLRAFAYYGDQMPDIDGNSVESINSIQKLYKPLRDKSKNPTFTLTYQGTWNTLVVKYKFTPELAKQVEARYHELYKVSDDWVKAKLDQAAKDGYVTVAFGLRVRTPLLAQVIRGVRATPSEAEAEGRSAGNALGQSWCLLNSRACSAFMAEVRESPWQLDIRPCAQIHDAQYYLLRDNVEVVAYTNDRLVEAVQWQDHPEIWHDEVKLGGELSLFWPNWAKEITIPNGAGEDEILALIEKKLAPAVSTPP